MKILAIIGKSGSGKTTLGTILEKIRPAEYKRIVQYTTRNMRENETEGIDYHFVTKSVFKAMIEDNPNVLTCKVMKQFSPNYYGTKVDDLDPKKINVVIASIEGIFDLLNMYKHSQIKILHITDVEDAEAIRTDGRDANAEQKYSDLVLESLVKLKEFKDLKIVNISYEKLKQIRNNSKLLWEFMKDHKLK